MVFNKLFNKLRIIICLSLTTAFLLYTKSTLPMTTTSVLKTEQVDLIRQALLARLAAKQKNTILTFFPIVGKTEERQPLGDIYIGHNQYELIGTNSGHLIIVKNLQGEFDKIKVHDEAVSCIVAKNEIVATGSYTCNAIHRWNIITFEMHDRICHIAPIVSMHIVENHFFVIDIQGNISLFDWQKGTFLCKIDTEIPGPILTSKLDLRDNLIIIMATKTKILVRIDLLVKLDILISALTAEQLAQISQILSLDTHDQKYAKIISDANLPYQIKELFNP